ncbi:Oxidoreductase, short chain dehydrogenase/reductase family superfamily [Mycena venus]|uniref:Oxidoreductase, short chain dehydrogenase/reductase family superfamily n=1 Tax=Mycena venus TaxID=2733690 RepID=A0A8H6XJM3_9AGAR|nr:Oxidoreductase, short chain dehydrogenase/reductase family superfamily [Mycena venus]
MQQFQLCLTALSSSAYGQGGAGDSQKYRRRKLNARSSKNGPHSSRRKVCQKNQNNSAQLEASVPPSPKHTQILAIRSTPLLALPPPPSSPAHPNITWIPSIDIASESAGTALASALPAHAVIDILIVTAGYFVSETFDEPKRSSPRGRSRQISVFPEEARAGEGGKVVLVSSESGSIGLRHANEGGGNYAHHASKSALNMVGKLLSLDIAERGITVAIVHPGFMRTDMTKNVGYDQYWDSGGAVTPDEAATSLIPFIETFTMDMTGQYWAPRGARDIGTAEAILGKNLPIPLQLPW